MGTAAEFSADSRVADADDTDDIAVLLIEEGNSAGCDSFFIRFLSRSDDMSFSDLVVDDLLNFGDLISSHSRKMREVESQVICTNQRAALLDMIAQDLSQSHVQ